MKESAMKKMTERKVIVSRTRGKGLRYTVSCSALRGGCGKWFNCSRPFATPEYVPKARPSPRCPSCGAK